MKILILEGHHRNRYFDVSDTKRLNKVALSVVRSRFNDGYFNYIPDPPNPPDFTQDQYEKMPASVKRAASEVLEKFTRDKLLYEKELREIELIKKCLCKNDGKLAWSILNLRKHYEDEGFEIVDVEKEY